MSFYKDISPYYKKLFPLKRSKVDFLADVFDRNSARKVMDLACGAGDLAWALAERGFWVVGVDAEESLLAGVEGGVNSGIKPEFVVSRMEELAFTRRESFDAVICLGNSLPHLGDGGVIREVVMGGASLLRLGGVMCLQAINFGVVRARGEVRLPELACGEEPGGITATLIRKYRAGDGGAVFAPELSVNGEGREYEIPMYPLEYEELCRFLHDGGLHEQAAFADFSGREYGSSDLSFIVVAKKVDAY